MLGHTTRPPSFFTTILYTCVALSVLLSACNKKAAEGNPPAATPAMAKAAPSEMADAPITSAVLQSAAPQANSATALGKQSNSEGVALSGKAVSGIEQLSSSTLSAANGEHQFVRSANATFLVKDVYRTALAIEDITARHAGFVLNNDIENIEQRQQSLRISGNKKLEVREYVINGRLLLRIPSAKTQDFLRAIAGQIIFLDRRSFAAQDVQFDLLRQQLEYRRLHETQETLGKIVNSGAKTTQKAEVVYGQNDFKAGRDEALVKRKEALDNVAYATVELHLHQLPEVRKYEVEDIDAIFEQFRPSFSKRAGDALCNGWLALTDFAINALAAWPIFLLAMLIGIVWRVKRAKTAK